MTRRNETDQAEVCRTTPPPRSDEDGGSGPASAEAPTTGAESKAARRSGDRATARPPTPANSRATTKTARRTLTLDAKAEKRLRDHAHVTRVDAGKIVSELIKAYLPSYSVSIHIRSKPDSDTGEDRQTEAA